MSLEVAVLRMVNHYMINYNYLLVDHISRNALIVDPAWHIDKVEYALYSRAAQLKGILITHAHRDHIDLAKPLSEKYRIPIWISKEEVAASGFDAANIELLNNNTPWVTASMTVEPILTPGHTPGCICFKVGDNLFTGDVLFAEGCGIVPSVEAAYQMYDSIQLLKSRVADSTRIYPGHSYGVTPGQAFSDIKDNNIYLHFRDKESFAGFRLRKTQNKNIFKFN
ncbi:hydroxyacylglutathione hydrolase [Pseudoalteromonas luteoviolacea]|uniref:Hydroxyacylglutathione hydrolase n=1 Tax=Pseudoalteromonas luteoviolacea TaxID=43657 RepID=A0A1C0TK83_9GAMM|nr:MBL fold metallo-hydrolase [Pseudoalteromonas luteoviolacea]OCQ18826.1 hydroxyacylglutathione hydrolase [Pseudoalteromonas luteoviolacea]